jgi:dTMP kinase
MLDDLKQGTSIILDRYAYSGVAFTSAKGLNFEWCKNSDKGLPKPDIVFFL